MSETIEKKSSGQHGMLMTEGSILKNIFLFSIPLILGNLLQQTYNAVDSIIVGNCVGSNALAAVGAGASLIYLLIAFSQGASVGAGIIISQYLGARDSEHVRTAVHTAVTVALILGVLLTIGGLRFTRPLLIWMNTPEEVLEDAVLYLRIYSGGMVFNVLYNMMAGILNAAGNSRRSLLYLAAAACTSDCGFENGRGRRGYRYGYEPGGVLYSGFSVPASRSGGLSGTYSGASPEWLHGFTDFAGGSSHGYPEYGHFSVQYSGTGCRQRIRNGCDGRFRRLLKDRRLQYPSGFEL